MKKIFYILTAALLLTGCTVDDTAIDNNAAKTVTFTATLAPKGGASRDQSRACSSFGETQPALAEGKGDATTRAITVNNQNTSNETLTTAWKAGEKIAVYYQTGPDTYATAEANVDEVNDGVATISASLTNAMDGGTVKFVYPASLANDNGDDIDENKLLNNQNGLLRTGTKNISKNFDAATGSGTLSVGAGTAVTSEHIAMENRVCICKIELSFSNGSHPVSSAGKTLAISVGDGRTYTVSSPKESEIQSPSQPTQYEPFETGDVIYVAMLPFTSQIIIFASTTDGGTLYGTATTGTLVAGKFYRNVPVTLYKNNKTLTATTGEMTLHNGDILTGTGGTSTHVTIDDGATIMLLNATIPGRAVDNASDTWWAGITCTGDANIILAGGSANSVRGYHCDFPGIIVPSGKTLTILGNGSLTATSGTNTVQGYGAGIGGKANETCGNIKIEGGTIIATGGNQGGAGIGGCYHGSCGNITISGGTVTATGGLWAAGIGSGSFGSFASISIGSGITSVTATRSNNYGNVPIGKGYGDQGSGAVTFDGVTMHDGREDYMDPSDWTHWPTDGQTYGGIRVAVTNDPFTNKTWTLTPTH